MLFAILSPAPGVVLGEVVGIFCPPLPDSLAATNTAPAVEAAPQLRFWRERLERKPMPAGGTPLARIRFQNRGPRISRASLSRVTPGPSFSPGRLRGRRRMASDGAATAANRRSVPCDVHLLG